MVEDVEGLRLQAKFHPFAQAEPLGQIEVAPDEVRAPQRIASKVSELAVLRRIASQAGPGTRIHRGDKSIRVEPLDCSRLGHARYGVMFIDRHTGYKACVLGTTPLHDAVAVRGIS